MTQQQNLDLESRTMNLKNMLVVGFVWFLILFQAMVFLKYFVPRLLIQSPFFFWILMPCFALDYILLCISYFRATNTHAGSPNLQIVTKAIKCITLFVLVLKQNTYYHDQIEEIKNRAKKMSELKKQRRKNKVIGQINIEQIKQLNTTSYCFKCEIVKQSRVHHCSICQRCIIRMDHHCPWTGNCIGKYNHKYFILFLLYATVKSNYLQPNLCSNIFLGAKLDLTIVWTTILFDIIQKNGLDAMTDFTGKLLYTICAVSSLFLSLAIGFLFITQMLSSVRNLTTLETFTTGIYEHNPWNKYSWQRNLQEIFGYSLWLLPTNPFPESLTVDSQIQIL